MQHTSLTSSTKITFTRIKIRTISSKMLLMPVLLRLVDLPEERGAAGGEVMGVWLFIVVVEETLGVDTRV